jgi:hypothetical protein
MLTRLSSQLNSLKKRGSDAARYADAIQLQAQLQVWIDPIQSELDSAEALSHGVGSLLAGSIREPFIWEGDTRVLIRSLKEQLVFLVFGNGSIEEEAKVNGFTFQLQTNGERLQAAHEAIVAHAEIQWNPVPARQESPSKSTPTPLVVLGSPGLPCRVMEKQKDALTHAQHAVIAALVEAGEDGLSKDAIEAIRKSARRMLVDLRRDADWAAVIIMPGKTNGRYRVRLR